ncbi:MAG: hypothetical protein RL263_367 [Bacteroidota bacterium]
MLKWAFLIFGGCFFQLVSAQNLPTHTLPIHFQSDISLEQLKVRLSDLNISVIDKDWGWFSASGVNVSLEKIKNTDGINRVYQSKPISKRYQPNDPYFAKQFHLTNIRAEKVWDFTTGVTTRNGDSLIIAVIDDGIDTTHEDLRSQIWRNALEIPNNQIDDDQNGYVDDYLGWNAGDQNGTVYTSISQFDGHGTAVAGIAAARANNSKGISGVLWNAKILPVNCYPVDEVDVEAGVLRAMLYVYRMKKSYLETNGMKGANIGALNMSVGMDNGFPSDAPWWCPLYDSLGSVGVWSATAATNRNVNVETTGDLPSLCPSSYMISVNLCDLNNQHSGSGYSDTFIDIAAPGNDAYTTLPNVLLPGEPFSYESGTSFASPMVAASMLLLESFTCDTYMKLKVENPELAMQLMRGWLRKGVKKSASLSTKTQMGGSLDVYGSWNAMVDWCQKIDTTFKLSGEEFKESVVFEVYPQPIYKDDALNMDLSVGGWIEIYNFLGQKMGEWKVEKGKNEVYLGLRGGVYTVLFRTEQKKTKKVQILVD